MSDSLREALRKLVYRIRQRSTNKLHNREFAMTLDDCVRELAALSAPQADAAYTMDQIVSLTYTNYRGETAQRHIVPKSVRFGSTEWHPEPQWLLLAWDADKRADREFALKDFGSVAPQADTEAVAWQRWHPSNGWMDCRPEDVSHYERFSKVRPLFTAPPSQSAQMRKALELAEDVLSRRPFSTGVWPNGMHPQTGIEIIRKALSSADGVKESEGGASRTFVPETEEEANELADNGRNTGGKSYYRPSDPTPPDREAIADIVAERRRQREAEGWTSEHDDDHDKGEMAFAAACYAAPERIFVAREIVGRGYEPFIQYVDAWKWADHWWKPKDRRRDLVRAGALIVAEIERLDRRALQRGGQ